METVETTQVDWLAEVRRVLAERAPASITALRDVLKESEQAPPEDDAP